MQRTIFVWIWMLLSLMTDIPCWWVALSQLGSEHPDLRFVLLRLHFLLVWIRLVLSSTLLLQRWALLPPLPLPAEVGHSACTMTNTYIYTEHVGTTIQGQDPLDGFLSGCVWCWNICNTILLFISDLRQALRSQGQKTRVWEPKQEG